MNTTVDECFRRHRIDVDGYYRMAEVGVLAHDARVELIQGEIIDMVPIGSPHASAVTAVSSLFFKAVSDRAIVRVQQPIRLDRFSEPQPDLTVVEPRADFYRAAHPRPDDLLLLIEVSDSTLRYDRQIKLPLYASHAIPEVWVIDINGCAIHRFEKPVKGTYTVTTLVTGVVDLSQLPDVRIDLTELLKG